MEKQVEGEQNKEYLLIGAIAKSYGVSENCIRRMEAEGLLKPAYISERSGYRYYNSKDVIQIGTILSLRSFGFTNKDIRVFLQDPDNLSVLYQKLQEKQQKLASLLFQFGQRMKSGESCRCAIVSLSEVSYYTKEFRMVPNLDLFSEIVCEAQFEAIDNNLPVDYTLPAVIETASADYRSFDWTEEQRLLFHVPLRKRIDGQNTTVLPGTHAVEVKWSYPGIDYFHMIPVISQYFDLFSLRQAGPLRAAFNMGGHSIKSADITTTVMHVLIPIDVPVVDHEKMVLPY